MGIRGWIGVSIFECMGAFGVFSADDRGPSRSLNGIKTERGIMKLMLNVIPVIGISFGVVIWLAVFFSASIITLINLHDKLYL
jgi:hypothetical protein